MKVPTKEEVQDIKDVIKPFGGVGRLSCRFERILNLCDTYLELQKDIEMLTMECLHFQSTHQAIRAHAEHLQEKYGMEAQPCNH